MIKLHYVRKAAKSYKGTQIKKGMPYYWWKHRRSDKRCMSLSKPPRSALTTSSYLGTMMDLEDRYERIDKSIENVDFARGEILALIDTLEGLKAEQEEKVSNMEAAFPNGNPTLDLLTERGNECDEMMNILQDAVDLLDQDEPDLSAFDSVVWNYN